jgi:hypothetical protein
MCARVKFFIPIKKQYFLKRNRPPFQAQTQQALAARIQSGQSPPLPSVVSFFCFYF